MGTTCKDKSKGSDIRYNALEHNQIWFGHKYIKKETALRLPLSKIRNFRLRVESVILTLLAATSLNHYVELALTSEPTESCKELC